MARAGKLEEIDASTRIQHYGTLSKIALDYAHQPVDLTEPCGMWLYGESGVGKTHWARANFPESYLKSLDANWDWYRGQSVVIVEDMDVFHKSLGKQFKDWGDKYPFRANAKYGGGVYRPTRVIVTSQYRIRDIWDDRQTFVAIARRFKEYLKESKESEPVLLAEIL